LGDVVDFKAEIGRNKGRLRWGNVNTRDIGIGMLVCEVDGPDSGSGAYIEDDGVGFYGNQCKFFFEQQEEDVVGDVELFVLVVVIWCPVLVAIFM
jgi:hypothetical protein